MDLEDGGKAGAEGAGLLITGLPFRPVLQDGFVDGKFAGFVNAIGIPVNQLLMFAGKHTDAEKGGGSFTARGTGQARDEELAGDELEFWLEGRVVSQEVADGFITIDGKGGRISRAFFKKSASEQLYMAGLDDGMAFTGTMGPGHIA